MNGPVPFAFAYMIPVGLVHVILMTEGDNVGAAVTKTAAVSEQPPLVHMKLYSPAVLKAVMEVDGVVGFVIVAEPGLPDWADHVPEPVAAIVAVPPGRVAQLTI